MRRIVVVCSLVTALLIIPGLNISAPGHAQGKSAKTAAKAAAFGNSDAITAEELKVYDSFLASDQMEGRNVPSRGYDAAALYIASHMKEWGLKPGGAVGAADPLQSYFMSIELVTTQLDAAGMKLSVTLPPATGRGGRGGAAAPAAAGARADAAGQAITTHTYEFGAEWTLPAGGGRGGGRGGGALQPVDFSAAPMVFVGNGYVINKSNTNPYQGIDVRGKVLVVAGQPVELAAAQQAGQAAMAGRGGGRGGAPVNPLGTENTDFMTPQGYAAKNGALAVITVPTFAQLSSMASPAPAGEGRGAGLNGPPYQVVKFQSVRQASVPVIVAGLELTNALFQGERLSAAQVFEGGAAGARLNSFDLSPEKKVSLRVAVNSSGRRTENVYAVIEGSDPVLKNEYVVFSAHLDHVGLAVPDASGDGINNGADDDASGCAALMAIAHAYQQGMEKGMRPKRSLIFLWVAGEEKGLWGSQYFNQFPPIDISKVVLDLNIDMIGRSKAAGYVDPPAYKLAEFNEVFVVGPGISSEDLNKRLESVNAAYQKMRLNHFYDVTEPDATHDNLGPGTRGQSIFTRSDHYNFAKMGIPVAFFTTGLHSDYHRVSDSFERIDFTQMLAITKTIAALGWTEANAAAPPKLNEKLPARLVNDMKNAKEQGWGKLTPVLGPESKKE